MAQETLDVLAFGAHPDDVELGCGGTLHKLARQGYRVGIVDLTEGELGTRGTVEERYKESAEAARIIGAVARENLKIPDAAIHFTEENRHKVIDIIRRYRPSIVFAPHGEDRHPDHRHAGELVTEAAFYAGLKKLSPGGFPAHRPNRVVFYMMTYEFSPTFVVDITREFATKLKAIQAHRSQFYNPDYPGEETFISSRDYFEAIEFRARHFGWKAGVRYGEPFRVRELLALEDPFPILTRNQG